MIYQAQAPITYSESLLDYERDIKTDLCWAIDTNDLKLLEQAYKAAKQRLGGDKRGRPPLPEYTQRLRRHVEACACAVMADAYTSSFDEIWRTYFPDKWEPATPINDPNGCIIDLNAKLSNQRYGADLKRHLLKLDLIMPDGKHLIHHLAADKK
ncbi:hypothetical protein N9X77_02215 [Luminiphilus sp.]|nr:hypothetical protein [Luminiphilus sp.]